MAKAVWNGAVIAESDDVEIVENTVYFPQACVNHAYLRGVEHQTSCPWKGAGQLFHAGRGRGAKPKRGLVLSSTPAPGFAFKKPDRLLQGRRGDALRSEGFRAALLIHHNTHRFILRRRPMACTPKDKEIDT